MKIRIITVFLILIIPYVFTPSSYADVLFELGIHTGEGEISLVDNSNAVVASTKAGRLYSFSIGGTIEHTDNLETQLSFGIKSDGQFSTDSETSWVRYPFNAIVFYRKQNFRIGLGATAHLFSKYETSGPAVNASNTYEDAIGAIVEFDYRINEQFHLGLRYTDINYVRENDSKRFDGSSIGIMLILLV